MRYYFVLFDSFKLPCTVNGRDMKEMKKKIMEATHAAKEAKLQHRNSFDAHKLGAIDGPIIPHNKHKSKEVSL